MSALPLALGMESGVIADNDITATSTKDGHEAWKGRLNWNSSWIPSKNSNSETIKVMFTATKTIVAIATQGAPDTSCWVERYIIQWFFSGTLKSEVNKLAHVILFRLK